MSFFYTHHGLNKREAFLQRFFEALPGLTSWTLLLGLAALSVWAPLVAAVVVIVYLRPFGA